MPPTSLTSDDNPQYRRQQGRGVQTLVGGASHRERYPSQTKTAVAEQSIAKLLSQKICLKQGRHHDKPCC